MAPSMSEPLRYPKPHHSQGLTPQPRANPHGGQTSSQSITTCRWHSGEFFVVQDQHAIGPFDTLALLGWDQEAKRYFCRSIENRGLARD